jgi:acyl dehydratase
VNTFKIADLCIGQQDPPPPMDTQLVQYESNYQKELSFRITKDILDNFTDFTNDISPIHLSKEYAQRQGFKDVLVYGMLTASFYSTLVGVYLPGQYGVFQKCDVSFNKPVYIGDTLYVSGKITDINYVLKRITIKAEIRNQNKERVSLATLVIGMSE